MTELHELTAAPIEVTIKGKRLLLSPLTDLDLSKLQLWLKSHYMSMVREVLKDEKDPEVRGVVLLGAAEKASTLSLGSDMAMEMLMSNIDGMAQYIWLALQREQPNITEKEIYEITGDAESLGEIFKKLELLERSLVQGSKKKSRMRPQRKSS